MSILTPFRYAGSKNKLLPVIMPHLDKLLQNKSTFADGFVGGGSVLLEVAHRYRDMQLFANDKDRWVYSFWKVVSDSNRTSLDDLLKLMSVTPTIDLFNKLREEKVDDNDTVACAYRAIFFNRTAFSGILSSGPIGGQEQKSKWTVNCRYNFKKLKSKIEKCHELLQGRTTVSCENILNYKYLTEGDGVIYLDPPYFKAGDSLYPEKMSEIEHEALSKILLTRENWVLSYDDHPVINKLYSSKGSSIIPVRYCINGEKTDWKKTGELLITS